MDKCGLACQVLATPPSLFLYSVDASCAQKVARRLNEDLAEKVRASNGRFLGLATVPLQDPVLAAAELEYSMKELGLLGAQIGASVAGMDLDNEKFKLFLAAADKLAAPILVHPVAPVGGDRVKDYYMAQLVGFPFDTTIALTRMIFGGVLDTYPNIRWCFVHGGGTVPYLKGRLDKGALSGVAKTPSGKLPSEYLKQVFFDGLDFDPDVTSLLVKSVGIERIVVGTDWPFKLSESDPVKKADDLPLSGKALEERLIKNTNAFLYGKENV
jgi:aminocarboxymuconate-semialdehyde decarboxylase